MRKKFLFLFHLKNEIVRNDDNDDDGRVMDRKIDCFCSTKCAIQNEFFSFILCVTMDEFRELRTLYCIVFCFWIKNCTLYKCIELEIASRIKSTTKMLEIVKNIQQNMCIVCTRLTKFSQFRCFKKHTKNLYLFFIHTNTYNNFVCRKNRLSILYISHVSLILHSNLLFSQFFYVYRYCKNE
jgi:hypothetical protein